MAKKFMAQAEFEIETENVLEAHKKLIDAMKKVDIENPEIDIIRVQVVSADMLKGGQK